MSTGDWKCTTCNFTIFGRKDSCNKCGEKRLFREENPHPVHHCSSIPILFYDWKCPGCNFNMFGSRTHCVKCNIRNPKLPDNFKQGHIKL